MIVYGRDIVFWGFFFEIDDFSAAGVDARDKIEMGVLLFLSLVELLFDDLHFLLFLKGLVVQSVEDTVFVPKSWRFWRLARLGFKVVFAAIWLKGALAQLLRLQMLLSDLRELLF